MAFGTKTGIYKLIGANNHIYIGQTRNFERRCKDYTKSHYNRGLIGKYLSVYGRKSHTIRIIHSLPFDVSQKVLDDYEKLYISQFKECGVDLMNIQAGGFCASHSEESRKKMSDIRKGKKLPIETVRKSAASRIGIKRSEETKAKLKEQKLGNKNPQYGIKRSAETIKKMVDTARMNGKQLGKKISTECRVKLRIANNKKVYQLEGGGDFIKEWESVKVAQDSLRIHHISDCANGKRKKSGGFIWKY